MKYIELSDDEIDLLKGYAKVSPLILLRSKAQAVLMRSRGISLDDIAHIFSKRPSTIREWFRAFFQKRMASIFTGHAENENAGTLSQTQKEELETALRKPPSTYDIPKEFWDVPSLKQYVQATFHVVYDSSRSYHLLLRFCKLSFKYPDTFDRRRDEKKITNRMKEIRHEIKPLLKNNEWEVFASDEVRIELECDTRRAWLRRGERTIIRVDRKREAQSYIGFLNQKSFACHVYDMPWQNQDEVLKAFQTFLKEYPDKKICIVWDNAAFHKGIKIRNALKMGGLLERVHLIAMPPYAPDNNPIEHVWNVSKGKITNIQHMCFSDTKIAFTDYIKSRIFEYKM